MNVRKRRAIIVLGMHRSGTSALAGVLGLLGARLPARLLPASSDNPKGFFEPEHIVAIHDRILASAGTAWWGWEEIPEAWFGSKPSRAFVDELVEAIGEDYAAAPLFVVKDPRMCRLMPLWYRVLERIDVKPCFAIPLRNPVEIAKSLQNRNGLPLAHGCLLWLRYVLDAERHTRGHPRVFLRYPDILAGPSAAIDRMRTGLGVAWPRPLKSSLGEIEDFLDPSLRTQIAQERDIDDMGDFSPWLRQAYEGCEALVRSPADRAARRRLDSLQAAFAAADAAFTPVFKHQAEQYATALVALHETLAARQAELAERDNRIVALGNTLSERDTRLAALDQALAERDRELDGLRDELAARDVNIAAAHEFVSALQLSTSWRITAPLRWAKRLLGRMRYSAAGYPLELGWRVLKTRSLAPLREWGAVRVISRENIYLLARRMFNRLPISNHSKWRLKAHAMHWRFVHYLNPSLALLTPPREVTGRSESGQEISSGSALPPEFASWIIANEPSADDWKQMTGDEFSHRPLISIIIPVYKVPSDVLASALESIAQQSYPNWEACIAYADDAEENWKLVESYAQRDRRFRAIRIERNRGISANSNEAIRLASGEFIGLLDHDDTIAPWALYAMVKKINEVPDSDFLYSDKDCISDDGQLRIGPLFKPEWSPEMLYSVNYLTHFNVMRHSIVKEVGGFRPETDGAQDWDLFFRVTEQSRRVSRVIGILYHWRMIATSVATGIAAKPYALQGQLRTIKDRINRLALPASAELHDECGFRILWDSQPWEADIVIDAEQSDASRIDDLLMALPQERVRSVIIATAAETTCNNYPWGAARWGERLTILQKSLRELSFDDAPLHRVLSADVLVFVSSQIVRFGPDFLTELGGWCMGHPDIAFVSSLVLDLDERVVEAGAIVDPHLRIAPLFSGSVLRSWGWFGGALWYRNCSAASPWAVAMRRDAFEKVGGLDPGSTWQEAFVSLCLRLRAEGRRGMVDPHSRVYVNSVASPSVASASYVNDPYFHPAFTSACSLQLASTQ